MASLGALAPSCCALNGSIMLDEASISRPMRRPGNDTSCCVSDVNGSASAIRKNGSPARNSSSGAWRTNDSGDWPMIGRIAGIATRFRPGPPADDRPDDQRGHRHQQQDHDDGSASHVAVAEQQLDEAEAPPLRHAIAQKPADVG